MLALGRPACGETDGTKTTTTPTRVCVCDVAVRSLTAIAWAATSSQSTASATISVAARHTPSLLFPLNFPETILALNLPLRSQAPEHKKER